MRALTCVLLFLLAATLGFAWLRRDHTIYAPGYTEAGFRSIRVGSTEPEVTRALGQPLSIDRAPGYVYWNYGAPAGVTVLTPGPGPTVPPASVTFVADVAGNVKTVYGVAPDSEESKMVGRRLDDVKGRFGTPAEVIERPDRNVYWYAKMRNIKGEYVRIICIDDGGRVTDTTAGLIGYYVGEEDKRNLTWIEWLEVNLL